MFRTRLLLVSMRLRDFREVRELDFVVLPILQEDNMDQQSSLQAFVLWVFIRSSARSEGAFFSLSPSMIPSGRVSCNL